MALSTALAARTADGDLEVLRQVPLLASLTAEELAHAAVLAERRQIGAGVVVVRAGEPQTALFVVRRGLVRLVAERDGREIEVARLSAGEHFGELALFDEAPLPATAVAQASTELLVLPRGPLLALLARRPDAPIRLLGLLTERIRHSDQVLRRLAAKNVNEVEHPTVGQRAADAVARFGGSFAFVGLFLACDAAWMAANLRPGAGDPYPFIFLNLLLTLVTTLQAPFIMLSQARQVAKDRVRADLDYQVNVKNETLAQEIRQSLDVLRRVALAGEVRALRRQG